MKVSERSYAVDDRDFAALGLHGLTLEEAWDIAAIVAFFSLSNRLASVASLRPNDEFYGLGR
jgi:alkylhydroperoxidase family enzyme